MQLRSITILAATLLTLGLQGQELPSRYEYGLGVAIPLDLQAEVGPAVEFGIDFNREAVSEGRLRIQGVSFGQKTKIIRYNNVSSEGNNVSVGYDWMPGNKEARAILGVAGMYWSQSVIPAFGFRTYGESKTGAAFAVTAGIHVRLSKHLGIEGQLLGAVALGTTTPDKSLTQMVVTMVYR
jgi:hypothetical protein